MNHTTNPYSKYRQVAATTASPGQLVVMLYDGAIRFLDQALTGFDKDDPAEFNATIGNNLLKAQAIISELDRALDIRAGGQFAITMRNLYDYFNRRLMESNINKTPEGIQDVIRRLTLIRDAWKDMLTQGGSSPSVALPMAATAI